jgi:hypothetical protein
VSEFERLLDDPEGEEPEGWVRAFGWKKPIRRREGGDAAKETVDGDRGTSGQA